MYTLSVLFALDNKNNEIKRALIELSSILNRPIDSLNFVSFVFF